MFGERLRCTRRDYNEAVKWYRKAAEQGYANAQTYLGYCMRKVEGVALRLHTEAAKWYRKAAEEGDASGQRNFGLCFENGWGVPARLTVRQLSGTARLPNKGR